MRAHEPSSHQHRCSQLFSVRLPLANKQCEGSKKGTVCNVAGRQLLRAIQQTTVRGSAGIARARSRLPAVPARQIRRTPCKTATVARAAPWSATTDRSLRPCALRICKLRRTSDDCRSRASPSGLGWSRRGSPLGAHPHRFDHQLKRKITITSAIRSRHTPGTPFASVAMRVPTRKKRGPVQCRTAVSVRVGFELPRWMRSRIAPRIKQLRAGPIACDCGSRITITRSENRTRIPLPRDAQYFSGHGRHVSLWRSVCRYPSLMD
jgi:hypothetical protein